MESREPFKTIFKIFNLFALWGENSKLYKTFAFLSYFIMIILLGILNFLSVFQAKSVNEVITILIYAPAILVILCYSLFFISSKHEIKEFLDNMDSAFCLYTDAKVFIDAAYRISKLLYFALLIFGIIACVIASVLIFLSGKSQITFYLPSSIENRTETFYIILVYQSLFMLYAGFLITSFQELFFSSIVMIHGYYKFCENQFINKSDIKHRIEVHLVLRR